MRTDRRPTCGSRERPLWFVGKSCHSPELRAVSKMRCRRFVSSDRYTHPPGRPRPWNAPPPLENDAETITRARPSWNAPRCAPPERARRFRVRPLDPGGERRPRISRRYDRLRPPRSTADSPTRGRALVSSVRIDTVLVAAVFGMVGVRRDDQRCRSSTDGATSSTNHHPDRGSRTVFDRDCCESFRYAARGRRLLVHSHNNPYKTFRVRLDALGCEVSGVCRSRVSRSRRRGLRHARNGRPV